MEMDKEIATNLLASVIPAAGFALLASYFFVTRQNKQIGKIGVVLLLVCVEAVLAFSLRIPEMAGWYWVFIACSYLVVAMSCFFLAQLFITVREQAAEHITARQDFSEHQMAEKMFERYRLLSENTRDIILFIRVSDGRILEANQAAVQAYGYELQDLLTKNIRDLRAPETRHLVGQQLEQAKATGIFFETLHQRKDGSIFPVEINSVSVALDGERVLLSILRNITERRQVEARLRESEEIFRQFLERSPIYIFFKDENTRSVRLSRNYETMLGKPLDELLGKNMDELFPSELAKNMVADDIRILKEGREIIVE